MGYFPLNMRPRNHNDAGLPTDRRVQGLDGHKGFKMEYGMVSVLNYGPIQIPQSRAILGAALIEMHMALSPLEFASGNASVSVLCGLYNALYVILNGSVLVVCIAGFENSFYGKK